MKISASAIKRWAACPLQVKLEQESDIPEPQNCAASFGTCVHEALELLNHTGDLNLALERFKETWYDPDILGVKPSVWYPGYTYTGLRERGIKAIRLYHESNKWEKRQILASEFRFCVPIGQHELSGIVDVLELGGQKSNPYLKIIDYKTSKKVPNKIQLAVDVQFSIYAYAVGQPEFWTGVSGSAKYVGFENGQELFEAYGHLPRRPFWYDLYNNKQIDCGTRDDMDYMRLYRAVCEIANAVEKDVYVPNISGDTCSYCVHQESCPVMIPVIDRFQQVKKEQFSRGR